MNSKADRWWGDYTFEIGGGAQWEIGSLRIAVQRQPWQWLVAHEHIETTEEEKEWRYADTDLDISESGYAHIARFVYQNTPAKLSVIPSLADRSVVSRPFTPFTVLGNENAIIYVSTPLWFRIATGSPSQTLFETPIHRPSDTWFGSSTQEGELCYASRTYGRLNLEALSGFSHRAITQVHIHNRSTDPLLVERLNLPVPYLSIFCTAENNLWTQTVTMVQKLGTSLAEFKIEKEPPTAAVGAELITPPRDDPHKAMLIRAFSALKFQGFD